MLPSILLNISFLCVSAICQHWHPKKLFLEKCKYMTLQLKWSTGVVSVFGAGTECKKQSRQRVQNVQYFCSTKSNIFKLIHITVLILRNLWAGTHCKRLRFNPNTSHVEFPLTFKEGCGHLNLSTYFMKKKKVLLAPEKLQLWDKLHFIGGGETFCAACL